jgi:uncharacterized protein
LIWSKARDQRSRIEPRISLPTPSKLQTTQTDRRPRYAEAAARARAKPTAGPVNPFKPAQHPPGVAPPGMAMDEGLSETGAWAFNQFTSRYAEGQMFLGYAVLSELAQRPEYRRIVEVIARQMTRKWIKFKAKGDEDKADRIAQLEAAFKHYRVKDIFREAAEQDGFFGRGHIYLDLGTSDDRPELLTPIGDGWNDVSRQKIGRGSLKRLVTVEAVWTWPNAYNSTDPLKADWYNPQQWNVMGKPIHRTRLLTLVGREVPDMLKPAYSFGGLALTQMAKPYVDNWLETRQGVNDIITSFSTFVLATNLAEQLMSNAEDLFNRVDFFNAVRDNRGTMVIDKATEDFKNVSAPLSGLDHLQAQAQEHIPSVSGIPLVEYCGVTPSGLNASSEGEIRTFYATIHSQQERLFRQPIRTVMGAVMLSEWGEVDEDIDFEFEDLWALDEKGQAEVRLIDAQTGQILVDSAAITAQEERKRVADDPDTLYPGLEMTDDPALPGMPSPPDMVDALAGAV